MVFNKDILFIHIGKTGGMSCTAFLCKILDSPVYNVKPIKHNDLYHKETNLEGRRHATISEAEIFLKQRNISLDSFKEIIAVIRSPYEIEQSLFKFYAKKLALGEIEATIPRYKLVARGDFDGFISQPIYHRHQVQLQDYFLLNGQQPKNLRLIYFENLKLEMKRIRKLYSRKFWIGFPHMNASKNSKIELSENQKLLIREKHKYMFENGYFT